MGGGHVVHMCVYVGERESAGESGCVVVCFLCLWATEVQKCVDKEKRLVVLSGTWHNYDFNRKRKMCLKMNFE